MTTVKLKFAIYSRLPLGKLLGGVLEAFDAHIRTVPCSLSLSSRSGREDLSREEVVQSAALTAFDTCRLGLAAGEAIATWRYGHPSAVPILFGAVAVAPNDVAGFRGVLERSRGCLTRHIPTVT